jgi:hypothetical protein
MRQEMKRLCALQQLRLPKAAAQALPVLLREGLAAEDALALAHNIALLAFALPEPCTPQQVLERFALEEIAALCLEYQRLAAPGGEQAVNTGYEEARQ